MQIFFERTKEQVTRAIKGHLDNCLNMKHLFSINNLVLNDVNTHYFRLNLVRQNTRIIDQSNNLNLLLFKEGYHIKEESPILNNVLKFLEKCDPFGRLLTIMYMQIMF